MYDSTRHTPFIKAAEMGNMDHVRIFMMGNDFDIDLILICTVDSSFLLTEAKVDKRFFKRYNQFPKSMMQRFLSMLQNANVYAMT